MTDAALADVMQETNELRQSLPPRPSFTDAEFLHDLAGTLKKTKTLSRQPITQCFIDDAEHYEARQIREKAQKAAETLIAEGRAAGLAEVQTERDRLQRDIAVARDQVVKETMTQLAQLASAISSKAIRRQLSAEDHRVLVDEALAEMNQAAANRQGTLGAGSHA